MIIPALFIYFIFIFLAALGLSCGMQDLMLWCAGFLSLVVAHGLQGAWSPGHTGSVVCSTLVEACELTSCGARD